MGSRDQRGPDDHHDRADPTLPPGDRVRPKTTRQAIRATPTAIAALTAWPGSFTARPQITRRAEIPVADRGRMARQAGDRHDRRAEQQ
jgi:hypothetical protein